MVQIQNDFQFHTLMERGSYKSRIRIYSIDFGENPIDVSNPTEVEQYGTLLKYKSNDADSNGRIGQSGINISNYYNKDEQYEIGRSVSSSIEIQLINDDGFFSSYDWGQTIVVYFDAYEDRLGYTPRWITCPLGVYWWERPTKTSDVIVSARANDGMSILGGFDWTFPTDTDPDWENGLTLYDFFTSMIGGISGILIDTNAANMANMSNVLYFAPPFDTTNMTVREILEQMAECVGGIAYIKRDGKATIKCFTDATFGQDNDSIYYTLNGDTAPTPITSIDIGEYTVPKIDHIVAQITQTGKLFDEPVIDPGTETLYIFNNKFLTIPAWATARSMVQAIYGVASGQHTSSDMDAYVPISIMAYGDPSVEAGDIIRVVRNNQTYIMPVFQQILRWNGADWFCELSNSGFEHRRNPSFDERSSTMLTATETNTNIVNTDVDQSGLISFKNVYGETKYTVQLPLYNGGVS